MKTFKEYLTEREQQSYPAEAYKDSVTKDDFFDAIKTAFHKYFPKSAINIAMDYNAEIRIRCYLASSKEEWKIKGNMFSPSDLLDFTLEGSPGDIYWQSGKKYVLADVTDKYYGFASPSFDLLLWHNHSSTIRVKKKSGEGFERMKLKDNGVLCGNKTYAKDLDKYFKALKKKLDKLYAEDRFVPEDKELWEKKGY